MRDTNLILGVNITNVNSLQIIRSLINYMIF